MHRERMKRLAAGLRKIKAGFDLRDFVSCTDDMSKEDFVTAMQDHTEQYSTCGAVGCAIGHFPIIFPEDWEYNGQPQSTSKFAERYLGYLPRYNDDYYDLKDYWREDLWKSAIKYLGIDDRTGDYLFLEESYKGSATASMVARRIELMLKNVYEELPEGYLFDPNDEEYEDSPTDKQPNLFAAN